MKLSVWATNAVLALLVIVFVVMVTSAITAHWDRATFFLLLLWIGIEGFEPHEDCWKDSKKENHDQAQQNQPGA